MRSSPWHTTPDGQWHAKRFPPSSSNLKKQLFITGKVLSETGNGLPPLGSSGMPSTTKGVLSIQQIECAYPCCALYTHSRAAKKPLAASLPATPALAQLQSPALPRRQLQSQPPDCRLMVICGAENNFSSGRVKRVFVESFLQFR